MSTVRYERVKNMVLRKEKDVYKEALEKIAGLEDQFHFVAEDAIDTAVKALEKYDAKTPTSSD